MICSGMRSFVGQNKSILYLDLGSGVVVCLRGSGNNVPSRSHKSDSLARSQCQRTFCLSHKIVCIISCGPGTTSETNARDIIALKMLFLLLPVAFCSRVLIIPICAYRGSLLLSLFAFSLVHFLLLFLLPLHDVFAYLTRIRR